MLSYSNEKIENSTDFYLRISCKMRQSNFFKCNLAIFDIGWYSINRWIKSSDCRGKSLSEALIFASTNLQYDDRLFIELQVQYMKIPFQNMERTCCVQKLFLTFRIISVHNMYSPCSPKRRFTCKNNL